MPKQTFSRFEKKFLITDFQKDKLMEYLSAYLEADPYSKNGAHYSIYNIYYDTKDNALVSTSIRKPVYKEKLRLRSYTFPVSDTDKVFLEIKKKSEGKVNKRRIILTYKEAKDLIDKRINPSYDSKDFLDNQVLHEINYMLNVHPLIPNYFISYDRMAYFAKDNPEIRITFDKNIIQRTKNVNFNLGSGSHVLDEGKWLMEIKVADAFPLWIASKLSELKIYSSSFSKYGKAYQNNIKGD